MRQLIDINLSTEAQNAASSQAFRVGVKNAKGDEPAELAIYGEIGNEYEQSDARSVGAFLRANKGCPITVRLNSPGGLAYDGITIHNALLAHDGPVKCVVEGLAASAASVIAMAGQPLQMYENAQLMIHRASVIAIGNRDMMSDAIDWLDKIDESIARTYRAKTGKALDKIMTLMKGKVDGTIFTAREAKEAGFCDEVLTLKNGKESASAGSEFRSEAEDRLRYVESARLQRIRSRRDFFPSLAVPENPPNGHGTGVAGEWSKLREEDFSDKGWGSMSDGDRSHASKYFAYYSNLTDFGNLHLGHHFPPNHASSGRPSLDGVRSALSRLDQVEGMSAQDRERAKAHLDAHMPKEE